MGKGLQRANAEFSVRPYEPENGSFWIGATFNEQ